MRKGQKRGRNCRGVERTAGKENEKKKLEGQTAGSEEQEIIEERKKGKERKGGNEMGEGSR